MKKSDWLQAKLSNLSVPEADETAKGRALDRSLIALQNQVPESVPGNTGSWLGLLTGAVLMLFVLLGMWKISQGIWMENKSDDLQVLNQFASLFPGRLKAVVEQDGEVDVKLSEADAAPSQQPLAVVLKRGTKTLRVLCYSGSEVCLNLDGQRKCFEVLARANGEVIVAGEDFVWSPQNPHTLDGYRVQATALTL